MHYNSSLAENASGKGNIENVKWELPSEGRGSTKEFAAINSVFSM